MSVAHLFSDKVHSMKPIAIREIVKRTMAPDIIPFTAGKPAPSLFPIEALKAHSARILDEYSTDALQYSSTEGFPYLRGMIAQRMSDAGQSEVKHEDILIISGSQQAIDITAKIFLNRGDKVVVSKPTYTGALGTFNVYGVHYLGVDCDEEGMLPDSLEAALQQSPKLIYCIPNFLNPTGVDMSLSRRQTLVALAEKYNVPILEDDPYGSLRFEGEPLPSLFDLAPERTIYAGSFSKILAPGLRLGWVAAKKEIMRPLITAKQTTDLQTAIFTQMLVYDLSQNGFLDEQIARCQQYYYQQRGYMLEAIDYHFPEKIAYTAPAGGMFLWCELPSRLDAVELLEEAIEQKVAYIPGSPFFPDGEGRNTLRLSYSLANQEQIEMGIRKLGQVFGKAITGYNENLV